MTEDLEQRLRAIDPYPLDVPVERADTPSARTLLGSIMDTHTDPSTDTDSSPPERNRFRRRVITAALGAAAAALVAFGAFAVLGDDDGGDPEIAAPTTPAPTEPAPKVVTFALPASDQISQMCLAVTDFVPDPSTVAFAGTVTAVDAGTVTLDVTRWFTAGDATVVELRGGGTDVSVALDGVEFTVGGDYLVSVFNDDVLICGVSAPVSPDLELLYEQWYG